MCILRIFLFRLTILKIDNSLVRNLLIINVAIEQTVLIPKREDGHKFMNENPAGKPRNVKATLTHHAKIRGQGHRFVSSNISQRVDPITRWVRPPRIQTDNEAQIRHVAANSIPV
jgi:hypothetical protein